jgi:FtsP/CotA-like multicopper oxidase with cupredoxin domain
MRLNRTQIPQEPLDGIVRGALSDVARERLKADVVHWGLEQARHGQSVTEDLLQHEYQKRLHTAERQLRAIEDEYDRGLETAQARLHASMEVQKKALVERMHEPTSHRANSSAAPMTRRNLLMALGLVGVPAATAFGVTRVAVPPADAAPASDPNGLGGDAGWHTDPDASKIDNVKLSAMTNGDTVYMPFPGATQNPWPNHLSRLFPPPARPALRGRVREFTLTAQEKVLEIAKGVKFAGWTYDGTIPGPIIRVTQGDHVKVTLKNQTQHPHSIHFHSIHPSNQDGVFQTVLPGESGTYEFDAQPFGVFPYHCHTEPIDQHVFRGLYGVMIIDPPEPRPPAREMVMLMNGFDTNFDQGNELYSINGLPGFYYDNPIQLKAGQLNRVYLVNLTEFDAVNSFHMHANMFNWFPAGTSLTPSYVHDVVHLGVGDRGILEFTYPTPGTFMIHAHQNELTILGWKALFKVV